MKNLIKSNAVKYVAGFVGVAMAVALVATPVFADTAANLQATINSLMTQIQAAQAQLTALNGGTTTTTTSSTSTGTGYQFNTNLTLGSTGADVMNLQKVLNSNAATQVASTGAGSPGNESSYFGPLTQAAVAKFQTLYGISPAVGYVGPITRAKLNTMSGTSSTSTTGTTTTTSTLPAGCTSAVGYSPTTGQACSSTTTVTTTTGGSIVFAAAAQPANSLAPANASRVPFTTFTLTNTGTAAATINSVTIQRTGLAADAAFAGVELIDQNGIQIGVSRTFDSNHQAIIGNPFTLNPGQTETFTIAGNMGTIAAESSYAGQVASLSVVSVNTSATVSGSFPVVGAQQTINDSLVIGTATTYVSSYDPDSYRTESIGTTGLNFSGVRVTAGSAENEKLMSITWNQTGSIGSSDLANLVTVVNGTSYPMTPDSTGKYFTATFPGGILIAEGNTVDAYIKGDLIGNDASGRTIEFDIYRPSDIYLVGQTYGYGITPTPNSVTSSYLPEGSSTGANNVDGSVFNAGQPFFEGSLTLVQPGTLSTISNAGTVAAQNIALNVPQQVLGGFSTNFTGEPVTAQSLVFHVTSNGAQSNQLTSVSLVDQNGNTVAGPADEVMTSGATQYTITLSNTVTFPVGPMTYTLKGQVASGATNGSTYQLSTNPAVDWSNPQGQTSGSTVSLPNGSISFSTMTVEGPSLVISAASAPAATNIAPGAQNYVLANINLDASQSGEDIRLSSLPIVVVTTGDAKPGDLSSCQLYNGSAVLNSQSISSTGWSNYNVAASTGEANFSFTNALTIPKGTVVTLSLECNLSSSVVSGTYAGGVNDSNVPSPVGVQSGISLAFGSNLIVQPGTSGTMNVGSASLAASVDSSSPSYAIAAGGATGVTVGVINLQPSSDAINLTKVGLRLNGTTATPSDVIRAYIYNSSNTQVGSVIFTGSAAGDGNYYATSTLSSSVNLPQNVQTLLTIKADLSGIGPGQAGTDGHVVKISLADANGSGVSSGAAVDSGPTTSVNGVGVFRSYPTVAAITTNGGTLSGGDQTLYEFSVTSDTHNSISLDRINVNIVTSTATGGTTAVSNLRLYAYTESTFSSAVSQFPNGLVSQLPDEVANGSNLMGFTGPLVIPQATTYYFKVVGYVNQITGTSANSGSVATYIVGDGTPMTGGLSTMYPVGNSALTSASFVWSPNATTTSSVLTNDWTNGYGVVGLPSSGTASYTLSK